MGSYPCCCEVLCGVCGTTNGLPSVLTVELADVERGDFAAFDWCCSDINGISYALDRVDQSCNYIVDFQTPFCRNPTAPLRWTAEFTSAIEGAGGLPAPRIEVKLWMFSGAIEEGGLGWQWLATWTEHFTNPIDCTTTVHTITDVTSFAQWMCWFNDSTMTVTPTP